MDLSSQNVCSMNFSFDPISYSTTQNHSISAAALNFSRMEPEMFAASSNNSPPTIYRPTPIRPEVSTSLFPNIHKINITDERLLELPLDLSRTSKQYSVEDDSKNELSTLPRCSNSSIKHEWISSRLNAANSTPNRMSYPREFKLMVINYYVNNGQNKYRTCKEFQITKSMLNGWLQKIEKIRQSRPGSLKSGRSGRKPQFPDIEKQLFRLYSAHLDSGQKVGNRWIRETARTLARKQCSQQELAGMCQFSERWLSNFKKRYHINLNRDWSSSSSGMESGDSLDSPSSIKDDCDNNHAAKNDLDVSDNEDVCDVECESLKSCNSELVVDVTDSNEVFDSTISVNQVQDILNKPGQLPIQAFYERFPWLCKKSNCGAEPGRRGRKVQFPDVEKVLFERLSKRQLQGERVSNRWLQDQARELAMQLCPSVLEEATKSARCLFSEHWLHNFKKRYNINLKRCNSPKKSTSQSPTPHSDHSSLSDLQKADLKLQSPSPTQVLRIRNWFLDHCCQNPIPSVENNTESYIWNPINSICPSVSDLSQKSNFTLAPNSSICCQQLDL